MTDTTTLNERRRRLRDFLIEKGPESVDMESWGADQEGHVLDLADMLDKDLPCGTVGCLGGWGAHVAGDDLDKSVGETEALVARVIDYYGFHNLGPFHVCGWQSAGSPALHRGYRELAALPDAYDDDDEDAFDAGVPQEDIHEIEHRTIVRYLDELIEEES